MQDNFSYELRGLLDRVSILSGFEHCGACLCADLANAVSAQTRRQMSETTVKRLYGFAEAKFRPSSYTLDTLALYCEFGFWQGWERHVHGTQLLLIGNRNGAQDFNKFFYYSRQSIWIFAKATLRLLEVNEPACSAYGYLRQEFLDMTIMAIRPPAEVPILFREICGAGECCYHDEPFRHRKASGELFSVDITSYRFQWAGSEARLVMPLPRSC